MPTLQLNHADVDGAVVVFATISEPVTKTVMVDVPGAHGSLDLSTALTGGAPMFEMRTLDAQILVWDKTPQARLRDLLTHWHGQVADINVDGRAGFWRGRLALTGGTTHGTVAGLQLQASVDPWRWNDTDTVISVAGSPAGANAVLPAVPIAVSPAVKVTGAAVTVTASGTTWQLKAGFTGRLDGLRLSTVDPTPVTVTGTATVAFSWREGALL